MSNEIQIHHNALFSIVTVCYNSENTIVKTLESILHQNYKNYEYIIIDGGSSDGTVEIIKDYEPLFKGRLKWVSERDNGIYDAFNKGIKKSTGAYIWIVNSDDWIEPNALMELESIALKGLDSASILCARFNYWKSNQIDFVSKLRSPESLNNAFKNLWMGISHPACVYSRKVYEIFGKYDDRYFIAGDLDHFLMCYKNNVNFVLIDTIITNMSFGGISTKLQLIKHISDLRLICLKHINSDLFKLYWFVRKLFSWILIRRY